MNFGYTIIGAASVACAVMTAPAPGQTIQPISSFTNSGPKSPRNPYGDLVLGSDGNLYGTTQYGGSGSWGTVFKVSTAGDLTILANFTSTTGGVPYGGLTLGSDGNFYGTTSFLGAGSCGTVFKMSAEGALTAIYSFTRGAWDGGAYTNADGGDPYAGLALGPDGCFYGATTDRGPNRTGTLFKITTSGALTTLYAFDPLTGTPSTNVSGANPYGRLTLAKDGCFYGTTYLGGPKGNGTAFRLTTNGQFTLLANFAGANGNGPEAALIVGPEDKLYGTTVNGGIYGNAGTIFSLTTNGLLTTLLSCNYNTPEAPEASVVLGPDGNLYGTMTASSGLEAGGRGAVFRLTTNGVLTTLANFYQTNGFKPEAGLTLGTDGYFYGTTYAGGNEDLNAAGCIYRLNLGTPFINAKPLISISRMPSGGTILTVTNTSGTTNRLWSTTNLYVPLPSWQLISTNVATNGFFQFVDTNTSGSTVRFYRVSSP